MTDQQPARTVSREQWLAALESGEYRQVRCRLVSFNGATCCIGVAPKLIGDSTRRFTTASAADLIDQFTNEDCEEAMLLNDGARVDLLDGNLPPGPLNPTRGLDFPEIAAYFRLKWNLPRSAQ